MRLMIGLVLKGRRLAKPAVSVVEDLLVVEAAAVVVAVEAHAQIPHQTGRTNWVMAVGGMLTMDATRLMIGLVLKERQQVKPAVCVVVGNKAEATLYQFETTFL